MTIVPSTVPVLVLCLFFFVLRRPPAFTLFPYTTLFRSARVIASVDNRDGAWRPGSFVTADIALSETKARSEEHTSELQSRRDLVCRLLLEKKNTRLCNNDRRCRSRLSNTRQWRNK